MASYPNEVNPGQFVGTTQIYDLGRSNVNSEDFTVRLRQNFNNLILALNIKDSGYYAQEEFVNGQLFYPDYSVVNSHTSAPATYRQVFRKVIDCGALPNAANKTVAHNINLTNAFVFTRIYGCATNPTIPGGIPLPYSSTVLANNIEVQITAANVSITTAANYAAYTKSHVVVEYIKA